MLITKPSAIGKWHHKLGKTFDSEYWKACFSVIPRLSYKQYFQMIQFKIIHRLLNVKEYLKKCNLEPEDDCPFCDEVY